MENATGPKENSICTFDWFCTFHTQVFKIKVKCESNLGLGPDEEWEFQAVINQSARADPL